MSELNAAVAELVALGTGVLALYFFVSLVVNLAQAQMAGATGDVLGHARALQQGIAMVILLAVAASAEALLPALQSHFTPEAAPQTPAEALAIWKGIARLVVSVVIGGAWIFTILSAVYAGLGAQAQYALGAPAGVARSVSRLAVLVAGGILTVLSVFLANWLIGLIL